MRLRSADLRVDLRPGSCAWSANWRSEDLWRLGATDGPTLRLVDRFETAPQRILSVYGRSA